MAKPDQTWKQDRALYLAERPTDIAKLPTFRPDLDAHHPYKLITVRWNRERCLHCLHEIFIGQEAAIHIDTHTVLCQTCAKTHIDELLNPPKKAKPKPAAKRARQPAKPPPDQEELDYLAYLDTLEHPDNESEVA